MKRFDPEWEPPKVSAEEIAKHPLGSEANPVRTHGPTGQRDYLERLACPDGTVPSYKRLGSYGDGVYGYHVDDFEVVCGKRSSHIYMDLYHPRYVEESAVPGFKLKPRQGSNQSFKPTPTARLNSRR
jgi:hypothetical protein